MTFYYLITGIQPFRGFSALEILSAKAPDELDPYRQMVLGMATAVAEAKKGVSASEASAISAVKGALGTE